MISVIIPAYNAEKYIERCIESITSQTFKDLEIIVINDGSKDNTLNICEEFAKKDKRIKILSVENGGVSNARNIGIENAKGDYIMFIDSDDYIDNDYIEKMVICLKKNKCEELMSNFKQIENDKEIIMKYDKTQKQFTDITYPLILEEFITGYFFNPIWKTLIDKKIIIENKIKFRTDMKFGEDAVFALDVYSKSKKTGILNITGYNYMINPLSVTNTKTIEKRIQNIEDNFKLFENIKNNYTLTENQEKLLIDRTIESYINGLITIISCKKDSEMSYKKIIIKYNNLFSYYINSYNHKNSKLNCDYKTKTFLLKKNKIYLFIISTLFTRIINKINRMINKKGE